MVDVMVLQDPQSQIAAVCVNHIKHQTEHMHDKYIFGGYYILLSLWIANKQPRSQLDNK